MWVAEVLACEELGEGEACGPGEVPAGEMPGCGSGVPGPAGAPGAGDAAGAEGVGAAAPPAAASASRPAYQVTFRARNRFDCASELEVLSPGRASEPLHVCGLEWLPAGDPATDGAAAEPEPVPVDVVTRQMETYRMTCDRPLRPHDLVRSRRKPSEMPPE